MCARNACFVWCLLVLLLSLLRPLAAEEPECGLKPFVIDLSRDAKENAATALKLEKLIDVDWKDRSFSGVIDEIAKKVDVSIILDSKGMEDAGVTTEQKVTLRVSKMRADEALRILLGDLDLVYILRDGVMKITSVEKCGCEQPTRIYDVSELLLSPEVAMPKNAVSGLTAAGMFDVADEASKTEPATEKPVEPAAGVGGIGCGCVTPVNPDLPPRKEAAMQMKALASTIPAVVSPADWVENGGKGSIDIFGSRLVISQTVDLHEEIHQLLSRLRCDMLHAWRKHRDPVLDRDGEDERVRTVLTKRIAIEIVDRTLHDAVRDYAEIMEVEVMIDPRAYDSTKFTRETKKSFAARQASGRMALRHLLAQFSDELMYVVRDGKVMIGSKEFPNTLAVRVYDIAELRKLTPLSNTIDDEDLFEMFTTIIEPDSWVENKGRGSLECLGDRLIVAQTEDVHEKLEKLLHTLIDSKWPEEARK